MIYSIEKLLSFFVTNDAKIMLIFGFNEIIYQWFLPKNNQSSTTFIYN